MLYDVPSYDTFTNIDSFPTQQGYANLVGQSLSWTPSELRNEEEERFLEILEMETNTNTDDPILSTKIDLRQILFNNNSTILLEKKKHFHHNWYIKRIQLSMYVQSKLGVEHCIKI